MTSKREELIAKARAAIKSSDSIELVRAFEYLAAEQSHTPTNDERTDDLLRIAQEAFTDAPFSDERDGTLAPLRHVVDAILAALRRPVQGEPECQEALVSENVAGQMSAQGEPVGNPEQLEPTDAQVKAGLDAYFGCDFYADYPNSVQYHEPSMRRALRAAFATEQGENR